MDEKKTETETTEGLTLSTMSAKESGARPDGVSIDAPGRISANTGAVETVTPRPTAAAAKRAAKAGPEFAV